MNQDSHRHEDGTFHMHDREEDDNDNSNYTFPVKDHLVSFVQTFLTLHNDHQSMYVPNTPCKTER
jgi:hypothetical protein